MITAFIRCAQARQSLPHTLAALGLLRLLAKEVDALEVMAAILSVFQIDLMPTLCRMLVMYPCVDALRIRFDLVKCQI